MKDSYRKENNQREEINQSKENSQEDENSQSEEDSQDSFEVEIKELEINEENIENSEALFIAGGAIKSPLNLFKENKETLKIYGTEDYVLFTFGLITPQTEFMDSKLVKAFKELSISNGNLPLFICHGLLRIPIENIVKFLKEHQKTNEFLMIFAELKKSINKKEEWFENLEDEDYKFFVGKFLEAATALNRVFLVVKISDYLEFISE